MSVSSIEPIKSHTKPSENTEEGIAMGVTDIVKATKAGSSSSGGGTKNVTPKQTNNYRILVDINGVRCSDKLGNRIEYRFVADYENANFPIRMLTVWLQYGQAQQIFHSDKQADEHGNQELFDIQVTTIPLNENGFQNKAFLDGEYRATIQENDTKMDFNHGANPKSMLWARDMTDHKTKVVFYLHRENELRYSIDNRLNFVLTNPTITEAFRLGLTTSNPTTQLIMSEAESKAPMGLMIVKPQGFLDFVHLLEQEIGFFKTKPIHYCEQGILFFLNRENDPKVKQKILQNDITLKIGRNREKQVDRYIKKYDNQHYEVGVGAEDVETEIENQQVFQNSRLYITPGGTEFFHKMGMSRNPDTIYKMTEAPPVQKYPNLVREKIRITLPMLSVNFVNPLTKILMTDSMGQSREFRVSRFTTYVVSTLACKIQIEGFRVLNEGGGNGGSDSKGGTSKSPSKPSKS